MTPRFSRIAFSLAVGVTMLTCATTASHAVDSYSIDAAHSFVIFRINHLGISAAYGRFDAFSGTFKLDGGTPSALTFELDAESVDSGNADRDKHLKSPDFFNAKQFPVIQFTSREIKAHGDHFEVSGDLTMLGVTKPLSFMVKHTGEGKDPWGNFRTGWHGEFTVKRSDFGMSYMLEGLGDEVTLLVSIEGIKK